jgi:hypothetical protein
VGESVAAGALPYKGSVFVNFANGSYQWVHVKLFGLPAGLGDEAALAALLADVRYRDSYDSREERDSVTVHGPYLLLDGISVASFAPVTAADAITELRVWSGYYVPMSEELAAELEREVFARITAASACYRLVDLRESAAAPFSPVGTQSGFLELVLLDRAASELALVVSSDD